MANIVITGSATVLKSAVKLEVLKKLKKYQPAALKKLDDKEKLTFMVDVASSGDGSIAEKAIFFAPVTHDAEGLATVTLHIPEDVKNAKEWAADTLANAYNQLTTMEAAIAAASTKVDADKEKMLEQITVQ